MFLKKKHYFRISMIGAGNIASLLAPALESAGHRIVEVYSRHLKNAQTLGDSLYEAEVHHHLDFSQSVAKIFMLAVPDDRIRGVAAQLVLPADAILMHTSGSIPLEVLHQAGHAASAVLYPLQTFTKNKKVNFQEIPLLIEGSNPATLSVVRQVAESISKHVQEMSSEQRAVLHIAAVFSCNFTNHLIRIAEELTETHHIDFNLLKPLIAETVNKSLSIGPQKAQTGPAARKDIETIQRQMDFLKAKDQKLAQLYQLLSDSIMKIH
jgi:predicted short-subunit dehydrogenase-like oxidoreductase (DUF2520 family)